MAIFKKNLVFKHVEKEIFFDFIYFILNFYLFPKNFMSIKIHTRFKALKYQRKIFALGFPKNFFSSKFL